MLDDRLAVSLGLISDGQQLVLRISASINQGISWPGATWHPLDAVQLRIGSLGELNGLCAHYLYNSWWTRPHFDQNIALLPERTQSLLWQASSCYRHMITFCDEQLRSEMSGVALGGLQLTIAPQKAGVRSLSG